MFPVGGLDLYLAADPCTSSRNGRWGTTVIKDLLLHSRSWSVRCTDPWCGKGRSCKIVRPLLARVNGNMYLVCLAQKLDKNKCVTLPLDVRTIFMKKTWHPKGYFFFVYLFDRVVLLFVFSTRWAIDHNMACVGRLSLQRKQCVYLLQLKIDRWWKKKHTHTHLNEYTSTQARGGLMGLLLQ